MTNLEDPNLSQRPIPGDESNNRRWVLWSFVALVAVFGFFLAVGRVDFSGLTASDKSNPQTETTGQVRSGGSATLPKGPESR